MIDSNKISYIFCLVVEFCKDFDETTGPFILDGSPKRPPIMSKSEVALSCTL
jgi:hypothetical protein